MNDGTRPTVVACVDNSVTARPVLVMARAVAPLLGAEVDAVHVVEDGDRTARSAAEDLGIRLTTLSGDPVEQLIAAANGERVVAVVVGARALPGIRTPGHLALALANLTAPPTLVVPPEAEPRDRVRRVLIAMEGTPSNSRDLKNAIALVTDAELELIVVHVDDKDAVPSFTDQIQYETEAYADEFLARYLPGAPAVRLELRIGDPVEEILRVADQSAPDLLAIGWRQSEGRPRGPVAHELLARSPLPLLLVALKE